MERTVTDPRVLPLPMPSKQQQQQQNSQPSSRAQRNGIKTSAAQAQHPPRVMEVLTFSSLIKSSILLKNGSLETEFKQWKGKQKYCYKCCVQLQETCMHSTYDDIGTEQRVVSCRIECTQVKRGPSGQLKMSTDNGGATRAAAGSVVAQSTAVAGAVASSSAAHPQKGGDSGRTVTAPVQEQDSNTRKDGRHRNRRKRGKNTKGAGAGVALLN